MSLTIAERFGLAEPLPLHPEDARDEAEFTRRHAKTEADRIEALIADAVRAALSDERVAVATYLRRLARLADRMGEADALNRASSGVLARAHYTPTEGTSRITHPGGVCNARPKDAAHCS